MPKTRKQPSFVVISALLAISLAFSSPFVASLFFAQQAAAQGQGALEYQVVVDHDAHLTYGLYYPATYSFEIPSGSASLVAQYRYSAGDPWTDLETKAQADFFNGVNAARFDYANNLAYLSVAFSSISDAIYLRVLDNGVPVSLTFTGIPLYYDNRRAAATVSLDDWDSQTAIWAEASRILTQARMPFSVGIISGLNPDWSAIQTWYDQGYLEPAGHTRNHPCSDSAYLSNNGHDYQIAGVRDDILANLNLRAPYVPAFFAPCGFESPAVRQAVVDAHYLADRGAAGVATSFSAWGTDGAYQHVMFTYGTGAWTGTGTTAQRDQANASFDATYAAGGIYHLFDHPAAGLWFDGSNLAQHIAHVSGRTDVWYAAFGELYLYHFIQERGMVSVEPAGAPLPTFTPTPTPLPPSEVINPADLSGYPDGTQVLLNFNDFPTQVDGLPIPANYGGLSWSALVEGAPYAGVPSWNFYIGAGSSQGTITFPRPVVVTSLRVSSSLNNTTTLTDAGNPNAAITTSSGSPQTLVTGWTNPVTSLTIRSSTSDHVFDDLRFTLAGAAIPSATPLPPTATDPAQPTATATSPAQPTATLTPLPPTATGPAATSTATLPPSPTPTAFPPGSTNTRYQMAIDPQAHQKFGLFYPVTYMFRFPAGSSGLVAQYRYNDNESWNTLPERTAQDFFNGINAARFDYGSLTAYLSASFSQASDTLQLRILQGQAEVPLEYLGIPVYYDNRQSAVTVTLDDWNGPDGSKYVDAVSILADARVNHTVGVITSQNPNWALLQSWIDRGYTEVASHSRSHPCSIADYSASSYQWQIQGSRDDLLANLNLPGGKVLAYIEPCGIENAQVRQAVVDAGYLASRGYPLPPAENTFSAWGTDGSYQRVTYTYDTDAWGWYTGSAALRDQANAAFTNVHQAGGIYHLLDHPWTQLWSADSYLSQHIDFIANRSDVWYAGFGQLYQYHYVQERGQLTVTQTGVAGPTSTPTSIILPTDTPTPLPPPTGTPTPLPPTETPLPPTDTPIPLPTATDTPLPSPTPTPTLSADLEYSLWDDSALPQIPWINDPNPVELGVKFRSSSDGYITGLRFYKGTGNTGVHTGHLWTAGGVLLAEATFTNETASGWQRVTFSSPVAITANTVYVASYHSSLGNFALSGNFFSTAYSRDPLYAFASNEIAGGNGVYRYGASAFPDQTYQSGNYWVDVIFRLTAPPATPSPTALPATATDTPTLPPPTGTPTPQPPATDTPTAAPTITSTPFSPDQPYSLWTPADLPAEPIVNDGRAVELGVKFQAQVDGYITGLRFYKSSWNTGAHMGHLWTGDGVLLGEVAFSDETLSGWQTASFAAPLPITAGTLYVASYHTTSGYFSMTRPYFNTAYASPPLVAPASGQVPGGNGVFRYGDSAFPDQSYDAANYWVDVIFTLSLPPTPTPLPPTETATPLPTTVTPSPLPPAETATPLPPTDTATPLPPTVTATPLLTDTPTPLPPTDTPTPLPPSNTPTPLPTDTPAPVIVGGTPTATPLPDLIFASGFESGSLADWSAVVTDSGDLAASTEAGIVGVYGLRALIDSNGGIYTRDLSPNAEPAYRARFYFDPNSIVMASGNAHEIFSAISGTLNAVRIQLRYSSGLYQIRSVVLNDAGQALTTPWVTISDAPHLIEFSWAAATAAGANDGSLALSIDGLSAGARAAIDNDTLRIDEARLGPVSGVDRGTRGVAYFDAFESRRYTAIGPALP